MPMDPLSLLAAGVIFATVLFFLLGIAAQGSGSTLARQRLEALKRGTAGDDSALEARTFTTRVLAPLLHGVVRGFGGLDRPSSRP